MEMMTGAFSSSVGIESISPSARDVTISIAASTSISTLSIADSVSSATIETAAGIRSGRALEIPETRVSKKLYQ